LASLFAIASAKSWTTIRKAFGPADHVLPASGRLGMGRAAEIGLVVDDRQPVDRHPAGDRLITRFGDGSARVIGAVAGDVDNAPIVTSVAVHPKSPIVAAGFDEGQVIVCAMSRQKKVVRLRWPDWERVPLWPGRATAPALAIGAETVAI
jgi:hypothetical protein